MDEIWEPISGYEGKYIVSNMGRVRSLPFKVYSGSGRYREVRPKILKQSSCGHGYSKVNLSGKTFKVHTLVATAFLTKPDLLGFHGATVNHKNGVKTDNRLVNLEWISMKENLKHARETGLNKLKGVGNGASKLTNLDILFTNVAYDLGHTMTSISHELGVCVTVVSRVIKRKSWKHLRVQKENGSYALYDQQTPEQEQQGELKTVFKDGQLLVETSLEEIRQRVKESL